MSNSFVPFMKEKYAIFVLLSVFCIPCERFTVDIFSYWEFIKNTRRYSYFINHAIFKKNVVFFCLFQCSRFYYFRCSSFNHVRWPQSTTTLRHIFKNSTMILNIIGIKRHNPISFLFWILFTSNRYIRIYIYIYIFFFSKK